MSVKQIRWRGAVLAAIVILVIAAFFALATVKSNADTSYDPETNTYTMTGGEYGGDIELKSDMDTTIVVNGVNKLTKAGPVVSGDGNLTIIGSGTLDVSGGFISGCNDLTIKDTKLIIGLAPGLSASGNVTVENADLELKNPAFMTCGSNKPASQKNVFNNTNLSISSMPGLMLFNDTVMTNCNVTLTNAWISNYQEYPITLTIDGGMYNISQSVSKPLISGQEPGLNEAIKLDKAIIKNTVIKANSFLAINDLDVTDSNLDITFPKVSAYFRPAALNGNKVAISGSKLNLDGSNGSLGISAGRQLLLTNNVEMNIKGATYGVVGEDVQIIHSSGKIQAADSNASGAVVAIKSNTTGSTDFSGSISLKGVTVKEPAGGTVGKVKDPNSPGGDFFVTAIANGNAMAKTVVLEGDHTWDAGKVTKQPTTSAEGVKTYTCTICGATKTEAIPKLAANGEDGTPFGKGTSVEAAEAAILALPDDNDPAGTAFGLLQLKASKVTKNSINLKWKAVPGATKYILFANKCGTGNKYKKLAEVTGTSYTATQAAGAAIQKGTYYKFMMIAADANGKVLSTSKTVHAATKGGKVGNHKKVTVKKSVTKKAKKLKKGKTLKLKAKAVPQAKKLKVRKHRGIMYETSNSAVAQVNSKGAVKGVGKGTCYIYAYAQNGTCAKVKVTVK